MKHRVLTAAIWLSLTWHGVRGASAAAPPAASPPDPTARVAAPATSRAAAAATTARSQRACGAARPFYWEIGDSRGALAAGSEGKAAPSPTTLLPISTASEWIFASYIVQMREGKPTPTDIRALTMRSGYTNLQAERCPQRTPGNPHPESVSTCFHAAHLVGGSNSDYRAAQLDRFHFNGGHFQWLAVSDPHLKDLNATALTAAIGTGLGTGAAFLYQSPLLDAGIRTTTSAYAAFLRRILSGVLSMREQLGLHAVCTNPGRCAQAVSTPLPQNENPHYSLGHWVEDDPRIGDGAFSDPGLLGFYPWIDASKTYYGVLARVSHVPGAYVRSMQCGRLIRKAWLTARAP